jgi:tetratricopeptide (TPR) repeat protein
MKRSLSFDRRSLSHGATELHNRFQSLGNVTPLVNHDLKMIEYRLRCLEHAKTENVGSCYAADGKFEEALSYYLSALRQREKQKKNVKCSLQIAQTVNLIGDMHRCLHQFEQALDFYKRAVTIYEMCPSKTIQDRLRTQNKISKVNQEISLKTSAYTTTQISNNTAAVTRPPYRRKQKNQDFVTKRLLRRTEPLRLQPSLNDTQRQPYSIELCNEKIIFNFFL